MSARVGVDKWMFFTTLCWSSSAWRWSFPPRPSSPRSTITPIHRSRQAGRLGRSAGVLAHARPPALDYSLYKSPRFIYSALCVTIFLLVLVFFIPGSHNTHRWIRFGGLFTFQPSEIAKPVLVLFLAWFLSTRLDKMRDWKHTLLRAASSRGLYSSHRPAARSGHRAGSGRRHRHDALSGRHAVEVSARRRRRHAARRSPRCSSWFPGAASACWSSCIPNCDARAPRLQPITLPVAHRRRRRRLHRPRLHGRPAEALLPARSPHRLHLRQHRRGDGLHRRIAIVAALCPLRRPRPAHRLSLAGPLCPPGRLRHHHDHPAAGLLQHQRRPLAAAHQRHSAAPDLLRRNLASSSPWPASASCSTSPGKSIDGAFESKYEFDSGSPVNLVRNLRKYGNLPPRKPSK